MKSNEPQAIGLAAANAVNCLQELLYAAELYRPTKSEAEKTTVSQRFVEAAYRLEAARDELFAAASGKFDAFAVVGTDLVQFGRRPYASAHHAINGGCGEIISEITTAIVHHHFPDWPAPVPTGQ